MTGSNQPRAHVEAGLLSTELAIMMPLLVLFALVSVFFVEVQRHGARSRSAADAAARAAALHRSGGAEAVADAQSAAEQVCDGTVDALQMDWNAPDRDNLRPGMVVVSLTCTESLGGIGAVFGVGDRSTRVSALSTLELWRSS
ncbi:MAG: hypothetical protein AAF567_13290 [Actinomycetota bacterium]